MRLDAHQHFTPEYTPDLLWPILKRNRFDGGIVVCGPADTAYHLELADKYEFIRGVVAAEYVDHPKLRGVWGGPRLGVGQAVEPAADGPVRLAGEQTLAADGGLNSPPQARQPALPGIRVLHELEAHNLTFELEDIGLVPQIAEAHPNLRIVIRHLGRPHPFEAVERAAAYPNVFGKISGLITHCPTRWKADDFRPHVQHALHAFGPHRLMFGSDWPSYLPEGTFKEALAAFTQSIGALPLEMREQILGGTAERAYAL